MELNKVLMVEDEKSIQLITKVAFQKTSNIELQVVNNGQEALDHLKTWQPDLILMDIMMPILTGPETLKILKEDEQFKHIPVIFLTAKSEKHEIVSYISLGAEAVITKPFKPLQIVEEVRKIFEKVNS